MTSTAEGFVVLARSRPVGCGRGVGLPHRHLRDAQAVAADSALKLFAKILCEVFGGGIESIERGEVIEKPVVEPFGDAFNGAAQVHEVHQQARRIEFLSRHSNLDAVIMAVDVFTLTFVASQSVSGGETVVGGNFKHDKWSLVRRQSQTLSQVEG